MTSSVAESLPTNSRRSDMSKPPPIQVCIHPDHPAQRHGHYGYGGAHWCSDFNSPLLGEANMGATENGWILIYEKSNKE